MKNILTEKVNGKYQLDLWRANEAILLGAGILKEHLSMTDICTCCNPSYLFSHRASKRKTRKSGGVSDAEAIECARKRTAVGRIFIKY